MVGAARRSWLYVPGDRPERFAKAAASGVDVVICDLEDSVGPANKALARDAVVAWLRDHGAVVRVNGVDTPWHDDDVAAIANSPRLAGVVLPKSQEPEQSGHVGGRLGGGPGADGGGGVLRQHRLLARQRSRFLAVQGVLQPVGGRGHQDAHQLHHRPIARSALVIASRVPASRRPSTGSRYRWETPMRSATTPAAPVPSASAASNASTRGRHEVNAVFTPSREAIAPQRVIDAVQDSAGRRCNSTAR